jgi:hypothetical protein
MKYIFIKFPKNLEQYEITNIMKRMPTIDGIKFVFIEDGYDIFSEKDIVSILNRDKREERS